MKAIRQFGFKLIAVFCILITFICFIANTPVCYASKVNTSDFYYSGTTKGSYTLEKSFLQKIIESLDEILDYILGILTMAVRIVFVGWTALVERLLTWILEGATGEDIDINEINSTSISDSNDYITIEAIVFNRVPLFDINIFHDDNLEEGEKKYNALGQEIEENSRPIENADSEQEGLVGIFKSAISGWYYIFRLISVMIMLIMFLYIGVKLAISSSSKEKALYKKVFRDWVVGMILVFGIHYIILAIITVNEIIVDQIAELNTNKYTFNEEYYEYGLKERAENGIDTTDMEVSIYDEVRTRAYDAKLSVGTTGMIMYMVMVYYAWKFSYIYLKRYLVVMVLILMAPFVAVAYAFNKVKTGKAAIYSNWFKELLFLIILQGIHALFYVMFFRMALELSLSSISGMILSFIILNFMTKAEEMFRKIFDIKGNLTSDVANSKLGDVKNLASNIPMGMVGAKFAAATTRLAARVVSKPIRSVGNYGFGKIMEKRANRIGNNEISNKDKNITDDITRQNKLELGEAAKLLSNSNPKNLSAEEKELLKRLREKIPMLGKNGDKQMEQEEFEENFFKNREKYSQEFDKLNTKRSALKHDVKKKWREITDPFQYVKKDKDGKYKRKKVERPNEKYGPILKRFQKKKDSVGKTFGKYMNTEFLLGFDKEKKDAFKNMAKIYIGAPILGFTGLLFGLPMAITEPIIGFSFLAAGISSTKKGWDDTHGAASRNLKDVAVTADGRFYLKSYAGKSVETMAEGMQYLARQNYEDIERTIRENNKNVVRRTKKHRRVMEKLRLSFGAGIGGATGTVVGGATGAGVATATVASLGATASFPIALGCVAGMAVGSVLTGSILNKVPKSSIAYFNLVKASVNYSKKENEKDQKAIDSMLEYYADKYFEVERQKSEAKEEKGYTDLEKSYEKAVQTRINYADSLSDKELARETGYEQPLDVRLDDKGAKKLTADSEKRVIERVIIKAVQRSGYTNLQEYDLTEKARLKSVKNSITEYLVEMGVLEKGETADSVIKNLDKKIFSEKVKLEQSQPHAIESSIVEDSIIEVMNDENLEEPEKVSTEAVLDRFDEKFKKMVDTPSEQTSNVTSSLRKQKGTSAESENSGESGTQRNFQRSVLSREKVATIIEAKKKDLSTKAKQSIDDDTREKLRDIIVRKKKKEIEQIGIDLVANQLELDPTEVEEQVDSEQTGQAEQKGQTKQTGQTGKTGRREKTGETEQAGNPGQTEQKGQAKQIGQSEKTGRPVQTEQAGKPGQTKQEAQKNRILEASRQIHKRKNNMGQQNQSEEDENIDLFSSSKSTDVVKMLQLQTQIHQAKTNKELASSYLNEDGEAKKVQEYKAILFNPDGSVQIDVLKDGSRRAKERTRTTEVKKPEEETVEEKQKKKRLLDIITRVNEQYSI